MKFHCHACFFWVALFQSVHNFTVIINGRVNTFLTDAFELHAARVGLATWGTLGLFLLGLVWVVWLGALLSARELVAAFPVI